MWKTYVWFCSSYKSLSLSLKMYSLVNPVTISELTHLNSFGDYSVSDMSTRKQRIIYKTLFISQPKTTYEAILEAAKKVLISPKATWIK